MKIIGTLMALAAIAAITPYKIEVDSDTKTVKAKSLTYELTSKPDESGEKNISISLFPALKKKAQEDEACCCTEECDGECCDICEDEALPCEACEEAAEEVNEE